jgi:hypothetical protein
MLYLAIERSIVATNNLVGRFGTEARSAHVKVQVEGRRTLNSNNHERIRSEKQPGYREDPEAAVEPMLYCPVCSTHLASLKCKLICMQCGYYMSCADYY